MPDIQLPNKHRYLVETDASERCDVSGEVIVFVAGAGLHALAIVRALANSGIKIHVISQSSYAPSNFTRHASVTVRPELESGQLSRVLVEERSKFPATSRVILILTNDEMVRDIASEWESLTKHFYLSWSDSIETVVRLQNKCCLSDFCIKHGFDHPRSFDMSSKQDIHSILASSSPPWIIKPALPGPRRNFKTAFVRSATEFSQFIARNDKELPFVVQEWIDGPETALHFCTMIASKGKVLGAVTGRKLRAVPTPLGVGSVMETRSNPEIEKLSAAFVAAANLSGPVSIEFKEDKSGRFILIEPNVGRMEHCAAAAIAGGYNFAISEVALALGEESPECAESNRNQVIWFDTEREPLVFIRTLLKSPSVILKANRIMFPYWDKEDSAPWIKAMVNFVSIPFSSSIRSIIKLFRRRITGRNEDHQ